MLKEDFEVIKSIFDKVDFDLSDKQKKIVTKVDLIIKQITINETAKAEIDKITKEIAEL